MPDILDQNHDDWPWPFNKVSRRSTAIITDKEPKVLWGSSDSNKPVPAPGQWTLQWNLLGPYLAVTTKDNLHFRIGIARWDDVDGYYTWPTFTIKQLQ